MPAHSDIAAFRPRSALIAGPWATVLLLGLLYVLSFVDRLIPALLVDPMRSAFGVGDGAIGFLIGPAFALFSAAIALPVGFLVDRSRRTTLILVGLLLWTAATFLTTFAPSFEMVLLLRVGVAAGEAALFPAVLSMIADLFDVDRRARASSLFVGFGIFGGFGAFLLGGLVVRLLGGHGIAIGSVVLAPSRAAFLAVALPGVALALLFAALVREPARRASRPDASGIGGHDIGFVRRWGGTFALLFMASALGQSIVLGVSAWVPSLLVRAYGWSAGNGGIAFGLVGICAALIGLACVARVADALRRRGRAGALPLAAAGGSAIGALLLFLAIRSGAPLRFWALLACAYMFLVPTGVYAIIAVQWCVPGRLMGRFFAANIVVNALLGFGLGPLVVGILSDASGGPTHLAGAMAAFTAVAGALCGILFVAAHRGFAGLCSAAMPHDRAVFAGKAFQ